MARTTNPHVEQKLLICALQTRSPRIRAKILSDTSVEDYGSDEGIAIRKRINALYSLGRALGDAQTFSEDPALTPNEKAWIGATAAMRQEATEFSKDTVQQLIYALKMTKNIRQVYAAQRDINELAAGEIDEKGLAEIGSIMERTIVGIQEGFDQQPLLHLGGRQPTEEAQKLLDKVLAYDPKSFVSTGQQGLDDHLYGWEKGNLVTISAPRGGGKSTMAMVMAINQYLESNLNVCFVSMEMTKEEVFKRILSNISQVPHGTIRYSKSLRDEERRKVTEAFQRFHKHGHANNCSLTIWDVKDPFFTPTKLETSLAPFMYDVIFVDYLTLFYADNMDTWRMQLEYSRYLKSLAKRMNCVIVVLTQLSDEERVKYGKGIEENTDYWMWWKWREKEEQESGVGELRLDKARHAARRRIPMRFFLNVMNITTTLSGSPNPEEGKEEPKVLVNNWDGSYNDRSSQFKANPYASVGDF